MSDLILTPAFPTALVMLALDDRDDALLSAISALDEKLGVQRVVVAHVYARDPFPGFMAGSSHGASGDRPAALDQAMDRLKASYPALEIVGVHAVGDPAEELVRIIQQEDVDLLVIGRNLRVGDDPGWGPSGLKLLRTAGVSALVVPRGASVRFDRVVCGLDFSHTSSDALKVAVCIADRVEAIFQYSHSPLGLETHSRAEFEEEIRRNAEKHFNNVVMADLAGQVRPTLELVEGTAASQVLVERAGTDAIVVGSRGLSKFAARLLGSTAERLAGYADGPVLIVRKKGESLSLLEGLFHR